MPRHVPRPHAHGHGTGDDAGSVIRDVDDYKSSEPAALGRLSLCAAAGSSAQL